jgi:hypothetical protein
MEVKKILTLGLFTITGVPIILFGEQKTLILRRIKEIQSQEFDIELTEEAIKQRAQEIEEREMAGIEDTSAILAPIDLIFLKREVKKELRKKGYDEKYIKEIISYVEEEISSLSLKWKKKTWNWILEAAKLPEGEGRHIKRIADISLDSYSLKIDINYIKTLVTISKEEKYYDDILWLEDFLEALNEKNLREAFWLGIDFYKNIGGTWLGLKELVKNSDNLVDFAIFLKYYQGYKFEYLYIPYAIIKKLPLSLAELTLKYVKYFYVTYSVIYDLERFNKVLEVASQYSDDTDKFEEIFQWAKDIKTQYPGQYVNWDTLPTLIEGYKEIATEDIEINENIKLLLYEALVKEIEIEGIVNHIKNLEKLTKNEREKLLLTLKMAKLKISKGMKVNLFFEFAIPTLIPITTYDEFKMSMDFGKRLIERGIGPCTCLWKIVPIALKESQALEEFEEKLEKIENLVLDIVDKEEFPGYIIGYGIIGAGDASQTFEEVEENIQAIRILFKDVINELKIFDMEGNSYENFDELYNAVRGKMDINPIGKVVFYVSDELIGSQGDESQLKRAWSIFIKFYAYLLPFVGKLCKSYDYFQNAISLERRIIKENLNSKTFPISIKYVEEIVRELDEPVTVSDSCPNIPTWGGTAALTEEVVRVKGTDQIGIYQGMETFLAKLIDLVGNEKEPFQQWIDRLKSIEIDKVLKLSINNIDKIVPYFNEKTDEEWNLFIQNLASYLESHPDVNELTTELIEEILSGS